METVRIVIYQEALGEQISREHVSLMRSYLPHFVCFPEYFFVSKRLGNHGQTLENQRRQIKRICLLSRELDTIVIGGTMPEIEGALMYNTCFVYDRGRLLGCYRKKRLFFAEEGVITPGDEYRVFSSRGITFGILICADVLHDEGFQFMRDHGAKIIFSPTFSPRKDETHEDKFRRDEEIYVRGARISGAVMVKACGVPSPYRTFLQARSLIASGDGVLFRVMPDQENTSMIIKKEIALG